MDDPNLQLPDADPQPSCFAVLPAGGDALCAAGVILLRYPDARVVVAHPRNLTRLLMQVAARYGISTRILSKKVSGKRRHAAHVPLPMSKAVHLVGLPPDEDSDGLQACLDACRRAGIEPIWHDGRGVLDGKTRKALEGNCRVNAPRGAETHTEAVIQSLAIKESQAEELLRVAAFVQPPEFASSRREQTRPGWIENADYVSALLEYVVYAHDAADFTRHLYRWAVDGVRDRTLLFRWRGEGRPLDFNGHSPQIYALRERIARIAPYEDATVLILGPSGAGHERFRRGLRQDYPPRVHGPLYLPQSDASGQCHGGVASTL